MKKKGFSLLEVLISIVIIMGGLLLINMMTSGNTMRIRKTALNNNVATLLERKMTELEAKYRDLPLEQIPQEESGDFGSDYKQYRWTMKSQEFEMPDMSGVLIGRKEGVDDMLLTVIKQTQEYISQSVKEVQLSVFVKTPIREIEYTISTYFVNYDSNLGLGGGMGAGSAAGGNLGGSGN